jgi:O-antigen/teichoic acid export membrane protein
MTAPLATLPATLDGDLERIALDVPEPPLAAPLLERPAIRFAATFAANVVRAGLSFFTGILIARALGAGGYGNLNFLLGSFTAITTLLDAGSTSAFYTLLSSRKRPPLFFAAYFVWTFGVQFLVTLLVIAFVLPNAAVQRLWLGHDRGLVLLAFAASFMVSQTWAAVAQMGEAARKTIVVQVASVTQAVVHLALIIAAVKLGRLSLPLVYALIATEYVIAALILAPRMLALNLQRDSTETFASVLREFVVFCRPIVIYCVFNFSYQFADRWLLQRFGGAVQQGFFAVGQQFSTITLLAATSIVNVFWKEVAEANAQGDREKVRRIYYAVHRLLFFGAATVSCALIPYSREILHWTVGDGYEAGALALSLMFLYPIHQALGHVQGTFYLAVGDTRRYTLVGMVMMVVSIPLAYFMVAPRTAAVPGLQLGAVGIAVKMVVLQVAAISVQMQLLKRSHALRTNYLYQATVVALLIALGFGIKLAIAAAIASPLVVAILGGIVYMLVVGAAVWRWPNVGGLEQSRIDAALAHVRAWRRA